MRDAARLKTCISAATICVLSTSLNAQAGPVPPADMTLLPYGSTANSVKLADGRDFHFVCMGTGSPTVILSAGLGDWSGAAWSHLQPELAKTTRVCAWDRPGFGLSDGSTAKVTIATNTVDLENALSRGNIAGPYVMVAHSLGSFETLLYADRNPHKVAGMVLVDPSTPDMIERGKRRMEELHLVDEPRPNPPSVLWRKCADDVKSGALTANSDPDKCLAFPGYIPRPVSAALKAKYIASPAQFSTAADFYETAPADGAKTVINPARNFKDMPLIVLTSGRSPGDLSPELSATIQALHIRDNGELAALSKRGTNITVPNASHYIQRDKPQAVIDAVNSVVQDARVAVSRQANGKR